MSIRVTALPAFYRRDPAVFTFSMHCDANFPFRKQASDLDVGLPIGMEDDAYLQVLAQQLPDLLAEVRPDLVLYDAGVDPHKDDLLGKLALSDAGLYRRDHYVLVYLPGSAYPRGMRDRWRVQPGYRCPGAPPLTRSSRRQRGVCQYLDPTGFVVGQ